MKNDPSLCKLLQCSYLRSLQLRLVDCHVGLDEWPAKKWSLMVVDQNLSKRFCENAGPSWKVYSNGGSLYVGRNPFHLYTGGWWKNVERPEAQRKTTLQVPMKEQILQRSQTKGGPFGITNKKVLHLHPIEYSKEKSIDGDHKIDPGTWKAKSTKKCIQLRDEIERLIRRGHFNHFIRLPREQGERPRSPYQDEHPQLPPPSKSRDPNGDIDKRKKLQASNLWFYS